MFLPSLHIVTLSGIYLVQAKVLFNYKIWVIIITILNAQCCNFREWAKVTPIYVPLVGLHLHVPINVANISIMITDI